MKDSCHSFLSSRECVLLRSKFSQKYKIYRSYHQWAGSTPPKKTHSTPTLTRLLEQLEYFFGCFWETVDSVGNIPDSCKLFNFKCLIYMRKLRIKNQNDIL